jgi:site-specific DNA recombinase
VIELRARGWTNKSFVGKRGQVVAGQPFTKSTLHGLLGNVLYRGKTRCSEGVVPGAHEPIVEAELWDAAQAQLAENGNNGGAQNRNKTGALLRGLVQCGRCGSPFLHTFTTRGTKRHRYYVCSRTHNEGAAACPNARVAAGPFEVFVANQIRAIGGDEVLLAKTAAASARQAADRREQLADEQRRLGQHRQRVAPGDDAQRRLVEERLQELREEVVALGNGAVDVERLRTALASFTPVWGELFPAEQERILRLLIERITYHPDGGGVEIELRPCGIDALAAEATT